eukprot:scaffold184_cov379-Prasinococcus_capsulatus_cf.AAC.12
MDSPPVPLGLASLAAGSYRSLHAANMSNGYPRAFWAAYSCPPGCATVGVSHLALLRSTIFPTSLYRAPLVFTYCFAWSSSSLSAAKGANSLSRCKSQVGSVPALTPLPSVDMALIVPREVGLSAPPQSDGAVTGEPSKALHRPGDRLCAMRVGPPATGWPRRHAEEKLDEQQPGCAARSQAYS